MLVGKLPLAFLLDGSQVDPKDIYPVENTPYEVAIASLVRTGGVTAATLVQGQNSPVGGTLIAEIAGADQASFNQTIEIEQSPGWFSSFTYDNPGPDETATGAPAVNFISQGRDPLQVASITVDRGLATLTTVLDHNLGVGVLCSLQQTINQSPFPAEIEVLSTPASDQITFYTRPNMADATLSNLEDDYVLIPDNFEGGKTNRLKVLRDQYLGYTVQAKYEAGPNMVIWTDGGFKFTGKVGAFMDTSYRILPLDQGTDLFSGQSGVLLMAYVKFEKNTPTELGQQMLIEALSSNGVDPIFSLETDNDGRLITKLRNENGQVGVSTSSDVLIEPDQWQVLSVVAKYDADNGSVRIRVNGKDRHTQANLIGSNAKSQEGSSNGITLAGNISGQKLAKMTLGGLAILNGAPANDDVLEEYEQLIQYQWGL